MLADDDVMADLHEIVNFDSFVNMRHAQRRSVNRHVRADFNIIVNRHRADLRDFDVFAVHGREAEPVAADDRAAVQNHAIAHAHVLQN